MRLNVSAWSIRKPIPAAVGFCVLMLLGLFAFRTMSITKFPNIDIPIVQVLITQSGAAPSELEAQVTKKVEDAVASLNGVWHISSQISDGSSQTIIQFYVGSTDIDRALNDVKDQIAKIRSDLPRTIDEPIVQPDQHRGPADRHLRGLRARHDRRAVELVRRRHGRTRSAEPEGRRRRHPLWRRRPRNPRLARSAESCSRSA